MALVKDGKIRESLVKEWGVLRNARAHADIQSYDGGGAQALFSSCNSVYTLLNELVLLAIGYKGTYTDYSEEGWPTKQT